MKPAASGAVVLLVASLWLPWHISGERSRNAFELLDLAEELELGPALLRDTWHWLLPLVPLVGVFALIGLWIGRTRTYRALSGVLVVVVAVGAIVVVAAPTQSAFGVYVAFTSCFALLGLVLVCSSK